MLLYIQFGIFGLREVVIKNYLFGFLIILVYLRVEKILIYLYFILLIIFLKKFGYVWVMFLILFFIIIF